jgi:hypothetical protein
MSSSTPLEYTTKPATCAPFNFGPASSRDDIVYTCERPGADDQYNAPGAIPADAMLEWAAFMRAQRVRRVITLLDDNELEYFSTPLFDFYEREGFAAIHVPMGSADARGRIFGALREAEAAGERLVAHCTHGMGRSGRVAAAWLALRYQLPAEDATREALEAAEAHSIVRLGNATKLAAWMAGPQA